MDRETKWYELEGRKLVFRTNFRPRSRYLYWHYVVSVLKLSYLKRKLDTEHDNQVGCAYWGTGGKWLKSSHMKAFTAEVGYDYEKMLGIEELGQEEHDKD